MYSRRSDKLSVFEETDSDRKEDEDEEEEEEAGC